MPFFRKKPVVIEALKWDGTLESVASFVDGAGNVAIMYDTGELRIATLEGVMTPQVGDWIIRGIKGELYPCKPDIFEQTYELVGK